MNIHIIGAKKGLGKYLSENVKSIKINRNQLYKIKESKNNIFIVCASNKSKFPKNRDIYKFYSDNILLIQKLVSLKHRLIIFMSTVEVYSQNNSSESTNLNCELQNPYSFSKIISEKIIINNCKHYVILRLGALLGKYSNNLLARIMKNNEKNTTLSENSEFNYILYSDVLNFINKIIKNKIKGIFNILANNNMILKDAVKLTNKKIKYGKYKYVTKKVSNNKIKKIDKFFNKSSKTNILNFINANT